MTVSSAQSYIEYNGDGVTKTFPIPFYFILSTDISITTTDANGTVTTLINGTDYAVIGEGSQSGGAATLNVAPASGVLVTIYRDPPVTQETAYYENGKFPAKSHEKALDKLTMIIQSLLVKLKNYNSRSVKVPEAGNWVAPKIADRKNKVFTWDDSGYPVATLPPSGSATDVLIELAKPTGATKVNTSSGQTTQALFDQLTDGTFNLKYRNYTVYDRLDEEISVGAIAGVDVTGTTDSTTALQNFFDLINSNNMRTVVRLPPGTYLTSGITLSNTSLVIKGSGMYAYGQSTTKFKASAANTTILTLTGNGCRVENLMFEGYEAVANFGATETCTGIRLQRPSGADIDSYIINNDFFGLKNGVMAYGRNVTQRDNLYSHVAFPITLSYVSGQQFRGHIVESNRFHSCGGLGAGTDATLTNSVCITILTNTTAGTLADNYAGNISITNNKCDGGCYQFFKGAFHRSSIMSNNDIFRCGGANAIVIDIDNSATVANTDYDTFILSNNVLASDLPIATPQQFPDYALRLTGVRGAVLTGNAWSKLGKHAIIFNNTADIIMSGTQIKNPNMNVATNGVVFNAIEIANGGNNIQILGLDVRCTQAASQIQFVINNASATNVMVDDVAANGASAYYNEGSTARTHGILNFGNGRRKEVYATATSTLTTGNFAVGDICWFTTPAASGTAYIGAVCVTAGTGAAAVWRNFGALV